MDNKMAVLVKTLEKDIQQYDRILLFDVSAIKEIFMGNIVFQQITEKEADLLESLYFTYEFSDKFIFVTREKRSYPSLYHFVESGVLSKEDIFQVLCGE